MAPTSAAAADAVLHLQVDRHSAVLNDLEG
jgi:hypothetical protein